MFKALLAIRLRAFFAFFSGKSRFKKPSAAKTVLFVLLMLYCIGVFAVMFFGMFFSLADAFLQTDYAWLFFAMYLLFCFAIMFITSVFTAKAQLYEAKDNELLLSLPIPERTILASRMFALGLYNLLFELIVAVPFLLAWALHAPLSAGSLILFLLVVCALNLSCLAITCLFAWLLARISAKMRSKTLLTTVFSLLFLAAYFYVISRASSLISSLAQHGQQLSVSLGAIAPLKNLAQAMAQGDFLAALPVLAGMVLLFALVYLWLSRTFRGVVTRKAGSAKIEYREKSLKVSSVDGALLQRETARLLSSSGYMLNAGLGAVFCLFGAAALPFAAKRILPALELMHVSGSALQLIVIAAVCMLQSTITFSASSVSLEGSSLWIVRSLPVSSKQVLRAKLTLHTRIAAVAAIVLSLSASLTLGLNGTLTLLIPALFSALCAKIGLAENLRHPNLSWTNEMQAVKQGIAVLFSMLLTFAAILIPAGLYFAASRFGVSTESFLYGVLVLYAVLNVLLGRWLDDKGAALFDALA